MAGQMPGQAQQVQQTMGGGGGQPQSGAAEMQGQAQDPLAPIMEAAMVTAQTLGPEQTGQALMQLGQELMQQGAQAQGGGQMPAGGPGGGGGGPAPGAGV